MALKLMDTLFYSPDGTSWNLQGPEVHIDKHKVVTMPVRKYTYRNTQYTVLACADVNSPSDVFYQFEVKRPTGVSFPSTPDRDFRTMKGLLEYAPLTIGDYKAAEHKLLRKIATKRRQEFVERMKVQYHSENIPLAKVAENEVQERNVKQLDADMQQMQASPIVPNNTIASHHSNVPRVCISDMDINVIKALLQNTKHNGYEEGAILRPTAYLKESIISMEETRRISDRKCANNKLSRDLRLNIDESRCLAVRRDRYKRPSISRMDAFVIEAIQYLVKHLPLHSGNGTNELPSTLTVMNDKNIIKVETSASRIDFTMKEDKSLTVAKQTEPAEVIVGVNVDDTKKYIVDDGDDSIGGILGVFCRSSIHGDYSGVVTAEKKIG